MRRLARLFPFILVFSVVAGCHAQMPLTSAHVNLTWAVPAASGSWAGCTTASPCTYVLSRAMLAFSTAACPATTGTAYAPINTSAPATGTSYSDGTAQELTVRYIAQTEQGNLVSVPSNSAGPFIVPPNPGAPTISGAPQVANSHPLVPNITGRAPTPMARPSR